MLSVVGMIFWELSQNAIRSADHVFGDMFLQNAIRDGNTLKLVKITETLLFTCLLVKLREKKKEKMKRNTHPPPS